MIVQDFDGVAVEDGDDEAGKLIGKRTCSRKQRQYKNSGLCRLRA